MEEVKVEATPKVKKTAKSRKTKEAKVEPTNPTFPAKGMVNAYGFIHISNGIAEAFGSPKGKKTDVTIDFKEGNLIISKV